MTTTKTASGSIHCPEHGNTESVCAECFDRYDADMRVLRSTARAEGRREGIEEAAKIFAGTDWLGDMTAKRIRALLDAPSVLGLVDKDNPRSPYAPDPQPAASCPCGATLLDVRAACRRGNQNCHNCNRTDCCDNMHGRHDAPKEGTK